MPPPRVGQTHGCWRTHWEDRSVARKASNDEEPEEELEETDEDDDLEEVDEDEVSTGLAMASGDDEDEEEEASLEDLLAQRSAGRRAAGDSDEDDDDDIMALSSQPELNPNEEIKTKVIPIKDRQEFVCKRCHLVKARSQLADEERGLCRDCV